MYITAQVPKRRQRNNGSVQQVTLYVSNTYLHMTLEQDLKPIQVSCPS